MIYKTLPTKSKSRGFNTCEYLIIHHTGTTEGTINGVLNYLSKGGKASAHYVIDTDGKIYQIGSDKDILWHSGVSYWDGKSGLNYYSIGIEVIGPLKDGGFTDEQRNATFDLIIFLSDKYKIPPENILRHKDISPNRKWDISDTFWNNKYKSWFHYVSSLFTKQQTLMFYKGIFENENPKGSSVFKDLNGALEKCIDERGNIIGEEFFYLMMIGLERIKGK